MGFKEFYNNYEEGEELTETKSLAITSVKEQKKAIEHEANTLSKAIIRKLWWEQVVIFEEAATRESGERLKVEDIMEARRKAANALNNILSSSARGKFVKEAVVELEKALKKNHKVAMSNLKKTENQSPAL